VEISLDGVANDGRAGEVGGFGDDRIFGEAGDDFSGGHGHGRDGADLFDGGAGWDEMNYFSRWQGVVVTLDGLPNDGEPGELDNVAASVEEVFGGGGADYLMASVYGSVLHGSEDNDTLVGSDGNDELDSGAGHNVLKGGQGSDVLWGSGGNDILIGTDGVAGNDRLDGGRGTNWCVFDPLDSVSRC
jgi:Ca2+-binding RTX toxin-like protein